MNQASAPGRRIVPHGRGGEFFLIFIVNLLLTIVTLGIYKFWATTRNREYLWSHTEVDGEALEYTGRGIELFIGFLKVIGLIIVVAIVGSLVPPVLGLLYLGLPFLIGFAIYGAVRYRLSHTRLRGVRFGLDGTAARHGLLFLGYTILLIFTLGLATPWVRNALHANLVGHMRYGSETFSYAGRGAELFGFFLITVLLTLPTLGLIWFWYKAKELRYHINHTALGTVRFESQLSGSAYFWLWLSNMLLLLLTLGLAWPWVLLRSIRYTLNTLVVSGELDYAKIRQEAAEAEASGEGLADALDVGAI